MTTLQEFRCEVCGLVTTSPTHWFVIRCGDSDLTVFRWNSETAGAPGARHYCGEAHAQVYISRWFESVRSAEAKVYLALADEALAFKTRSINRDFHGSDAISSDGRSGVKGSRIKKQR